MSNQKIIIHLNNCKKKLYIRYEYIEYKTNYIELMNFIS